jgi:hypothetical protein
MTRSIQTQSSGRVHKTRCRKGAGGYGQPVHEMTLSTIQPIGKKPPTSKNIRHREQGETL